MKSLSCISLSRTQDDPPTRHVPIDSYKDNTNTTIVTHNKGPKIQTLIEVLRCDFARPGRPSGNADNGLAPTKQWTPLYYAVQHNRQAALLHFLRAGQSPDGVAGTGQPPLCIAVAAGHVDIVRILCEASADTKATTRHNGETALHLAIKTGRSDMMDIILPYGPDLDARTIYTGETTLHYAAARPGSLAAVVALLKRGAKYDALNAKGCSPAEVALQSQNLHAAVAIISAARGRRNKLAKEKEMLLKHVEKAQNRFSMGNELIADIFEAGCDPDSTVLVEAIKRDDAGLVEMFLEKGADANRATATGIRPIFAALNCSGAQTVHALVRHRADVTLRDSEGLTVLQAAFDSPLAHDKAAISGVIEALLAAGADPCLKYSDGTTLLHHAVRPGLSLARVAQLLLQDGFDANEQDYLGNTALHAATHSRSCTEVLLKHGADANLVNHKGLTPLLLATTSPKEEPDLELLIKRSDIRKIDRGGKTALHLAAKNGLEKTVKFLLQAHAETTAVDSKKRTPLLLSVLNHRWAIVPLLAIQPGINSWDEDGKTALHHIAMSTPKAPVTWQDIAAAVAPFCEKGVSRSMRDRSGATPLIQAVKTLPEEGLPVIEALLAQRGLERNNCVGHEDHKQKSALYYAATSGKPSFVSALLKRGAPFSLKEWKTSKGPIRPDNAINKKILETFAEHEWLRRATMLQRQSGVGLDSHVLPKVLPIRDLDALLLMGLDPNALPKSKFTNPILWVILNQTLLPPPLPPQYLYDILKLLLSFGADPNATTTRTTKRSSQGRSSPQPLSLRPLTFLLEQYPSVDIDLITLFLDNGTDLSTPSPFYDGRYSLHSAVQANRLDSVDEFLTRRAEADCKDAKGRTPLFIAAEKSFWEIAELLLRCGAKADVSDKEGSTPLHSAVVGGSQRIVASLLRAGAKAGVKNAKGATPLACVPENINEKDKGKIVALLKYAEEQEKREEERKQKQLEREAVQEGRERVRKERELKQQKSKSDLHQPTTRSPTLASPLLPPTKQPNPTPRPVIVSRPSAPVGPPVASSPVHMPKQLVSTSIRYTPPSPKRQQSYPAPKPTVKTEKPLPQPRVDSGFGQKQAVPVDKPLPVLDRSKMTFDGKGGGQKSEPQDELASWLALSKALDRL